MTDQGQEPPDLLTGVGATGGDQGPDRSHYPFARKLRLGWRQDARGQWAADSEDARLWEVVCPQCGDTDGPAEAQSPLVRALRGPYPSKHMAHRAQAEHAREWAPPRRWLPGSAFPDRM